MTAMYQPVRGCFSMKSKQRFTTEFVPAFSLTGSWLGAILLYAGLALGDSVESEQANPR